MFYQVTYLFNCFLFRKILFQIPSLLQQKLVTVILILNAKTTKHVLCISAQPFVGPETHVEEMLNAKPWGIGKFADVLLGGQEIHKVNVSNVSKI